MRRTIDVTLVRKTSLLHKIDPTARRSSFAEKNAVSAADVITTSGFDNILEIVHGLARIASRVPARTDLLFTMSDNPQAGARGAKLAKVFSQRTKLSTAIRQHRQP